MVDLDLVDLETGGADQTAGKNCMFVNILVLAVHMCEIDSLLK